MFAATLLLCASMRSGESLTARDLAPFARLDVAVRALPVTPSRSYASVAKGLSAVAATPLQRARAAYVWIASHMDYSLDRPRDATAALRDLTGDCAAHAAVYAGLCKALGVECTTVDGSVRFAVPPGAALASVTKPLAEGQWLVGHTWNAVRIDGRWGFVDATMGGRSPKGDEPSDDYFLVDPAVLATDHVPDGATPRDLARTPLIRPAAWRMGIDPGSLAADARREASQIVLRPQLPWQKGMRAALQTEAGTEPDRVLVQPGEVGTEILLSPPGSASVVWLGMGSGAAWQSVVGYPIVGPTARRLPRVMKGFYDSGASLSGPFENELPAGKRTEIRLRAPGAARVVAFQGDDSAQFSREGDAWVLRAAPTAGRLEVMASYADPQRFQALLTYDVK